jgi:CheY-like chemotaxis protein
MAISHSEVSTHQPRAFVVDDSQIARYILSGQLEHLGYQVEVADSAESALRQIDEPLPDVVFMDHLLPGIDGLEAVSRLRGRSHTARLPIVMYTSQDSDVFAERARSVGADDVYVKSADPSRLGDILSRLQLLPERPRSASGTDNVTPLRRPDRNGEGRKPTLTRNQLARLLEPSLEAHHAKLHQELLGEFAILERYEERMRKDLFARVDMLARRTNERVDDAFAVAHFDRRRDVRRLVRWSIALAATMVLGIAVVTRVAWDSATRADMLQRVTAASAQAVQDNTQAVMAMQRDVIALQSAGLKKPLSPAPVTDADVELLGESSYTPNAADALVTELQSMGILGPVLIETTAGSFCVEATPGGMQLVVSSVALQGCEPLPVQLSVASYSQ